MTCPRIFLVRHGQSQANLDKKLCLTMPDHSIQLSPDGAMQAIHAGDAFGQWFFDNNLKLNETALWCSPYTRTRETARNFLYGFNLHCPPTHPHYAGQDAVMKIPYNESINLVEQQFGLFDGYHDEELQEKFPDEHAHYDKNEKFNGKFWARMPLGESRFDVAIRVHQFFGTLMRDHEKHNINNFIIVGHGVTNRAFAMQWLHLPFEWFEAEPNPKNCSIRFLDGDTDRGYIYSGE